MQRLVNISLMIAGILLIVVSFSLWPAAVPVQAQNPAPSPRPPVTGPPPVVEDDDDGADPTPVPAGRIAGTVIDLTTGAPQPGVEVNVNGTIVVTDENGNYELTSLPSGYYVVMLMLDPAAGRPAQLPLQIAVGQGDNVIVHLFYNSPATSTTPAAVAEQPAPPLAPVTAPLPELPRTSVEGAPGVTVPTALPATATTNMALTWLGMGAGALLVGLGLVLQLGLRRRARRRPDARAVLADLLDREP